MCLRTKHPTRNVAEKDIRVFKCITKIGNAMHSESMGFEYKIGEKNEEVKMEPEDFDDHYEVEEGYHSYNEPQADTNAVFIIPKGTEYIDGFFNSSKTPNRVSSQIIFVEQRKFNAFQRLLFRLKLQ